MFILQFGITKIGFKRGMLYGTLEDYPVSTLRLGLLTVNWMPCRTNSLIRKAIHGLQQDDEWHIGNCKQLRIAKNKARGKARKQACSDMQDKVDMYKDAFHDSQEKLIKADSENRALRETIKIVSA